MISYLSGRAWAISLLDGRLEVYKTLPALLRHLNGYSTMTSGERCCPEYVIVKRLCRTIGCEKVESASAHGLSAKVKYYQITEDLLDNLDTFVVLALRSHI